MGHGRGTWAAWSLVAMPRILADEYDGVDEIDGRGEMRLALAQMDTRLGDIEGICSRVLDQAMIAASHGAHLMCVPVPLTVGIAPTSLIEYGNFQHALIVTLQALAEKLDPLGIACLFPSIVSFEGAPIFEIFILRDGHVVPARSLIARERGPRSDEAWLPPVFDIAGTRVAISFDLARDMESLPVGTDIVIYFPAYGYDDSNEETAAVASIRDGFFVDSVAKTGLWLACMAPVGAYDGAVYTGGSFVMDDAEHVIAAAPCFEEGLLISEISHGTVPDAIDPDLLPRWNREEWLWESARLYLRDVVARQAPGKVALLLSGDLATSLLATLAVDAVGSRNVIGVIIQHEGALTPREECIENERLRVAREAADNLRIQVVECDPSSDCRYEELRAALECEGEVRRLGKVVSSAQREDFDTLLGVARRVDACCVSALTKTEYALCAPAALRDGLSQCVCAPFGDIYLSNLEFIARWRNRRSPAIPEALVSLASVEKSLASIIGRAVSSLTGDVELEEKVASVLRSQAPSKIDEALRAHIDKGLDFEENPLVGSSPQALRALMLLIQYGEAARRKLPAMPVLSARSLAERSWPVSLGWSDMGRDGEGLITVDMLVQMEQARSSEEGSSHRSQAREEIMGMIGSLFGITPEQMAHMQSEEGQRELRQGLGDIEAMLRKMMESSQGAMGLAGSDGANHSAQARGAFPFAPGGAAPFFSQN